MRRRVEPVSEFEEEVLEDFTSSSVSSRCAAGADFLLEELEKRDPDLDERCGLLADRYEIYALEIPGCANLVLVVSLDIAARKLWPCTVHGLLKSRERPCERGRLRAMKHFKLIDPDWEPANGQKKF